MRFYLFKTSIKTTPTNKKTHRNNASINQSLTRFIYHTKTATSMTRTISLTQIFEDNTTLNTIHENFTLYNI